MNGVLKALYDYWHSFGVPAYLQDQVPEDAMLPYITYNAVQGDFFSEAATSAVYWTPAGVAQCAEFLNAVKLDMPHSGKFLKTDTGAILLFPSNGDFLSIMDEQDSDGSNTGIKGARVGYTVQFYCT